ncbi:FRG domain-containing protein [Lactococcus lactis]|uniref:FRG domain-containing protein n=2 Tax=Lactococcus lactis TaxID=1358 RepID=UPI0018E1F641|nr:FRG domain-containing protein [Lactococcus lactis]
MRVDAMEIIEINSLTKFLSEIVNYKDYFFRGEPQDYLVEKGKPRNRASGFRWMEDKNKSFLEMKQLRNKYYEEIGYSLSKKDEDNFISYCQHHGLPTELIDITENPAVALYFACEKDENHEGMVYLFKKYPFKEIPVEKSIVNKKISEQSFNLMDFMRVKAPFQEGSDLTFLNQIIDALLQEKFTNEYSDFEGSASLVTLIKIEVIRKYKSAFNNNPDFFNIPGPNSYAIDSTTGEEFIPYLKEKQDIIELLKDESKEWEYYTGLFSETIWDKYHWDLYEIIWDLFADMVYNQENWGIKVDFSIFPYYILRPSVKFDRMVNQQGLFIVQQYFNNRHQELVPDVIFKINNKNEILQELDRIGISKKFIYPDHDNIAQYIKEKRYN